jgi:uncharacterized membrane protein YraQ (UPF0718 family)
LLITIPIAVVVQMSGAAKYINRAFTARPIIAILLATAVGAFSPLCSCSVIPVVAAMLIGGVPLAPVMSFWLASPSMDPEIFFLTVSSLGWELATWRLAATIILSLGGGSSLIWLFGGRGWLGENILRINYSTRARTVPQMISIGLRSIRQRLEDLGSSGFGIVYKTPIAAEAAACFDADLQPQVVYLSVGSPTLPVQDVKVEPSECGTTCEFELKPEKPFWQRLAGETWTATTLVIKFMLLA